MLQLVFGRSGYGKTEYIRNRIADKIDQGETQVLLITPEQYSFISEYSLLEQLGRHERTPFDVSPFRAFVMNATACTAPTAENR